MKNIQLAKTIFLGQLSILKKILDLIAFKVDKKSEIYKFYKKEIMSYIYNNLKKTFKTFEENNLIKKCECKHNLRNGYSDCELCGGSGWKNIN